jgi:hypothetical protein
MFPAAGARRSANGRDDRAGAPMIELASRDTGTLHVALFWARGTERFSVRVADPATGVKFELPVDDGTALDVYYHPYAYAAHRGVDYHFAA